MEAGQGPLAEEVAASGIPADNGIRVVRVAADPGPMGLTGLTVESQIAPGLTTAGVRMGLLEGAKGDSSGVQASGLSQGPPRQDARELIPDKGIFSQVELLLTQVMEENRS